MTEELLRVHIEGCRSHDEKQIALEIISLRSNSSRLGIQILIKPVLLTVTFVNAEREADWPSISRQWTKFSLTVLLLLTSTTQDMDCLN